MQETLKKYYDRIRRTNAAFKKANRARRRVMIAQDVIAGLNAKRLVAESGSWVQSSPLQKAISDDVKHRRDRSMKDALKSAPQCSACALGACFVALAERDPSLKTRDADCYGPTETTVFHALEDHFDPDQLELIECAFERGHGASDVDGLQGVLARNFGRRRKNKEERMRDIVQNIIKNKGEFVPPRRRDDPKAPPRFRKER